MSGWRAATALIATALIPAMLALPATPALASDQEPAAESGITVTDAIAHDTSMPLGDLSARAAAADPSRAAARPAIVPQKPNPGIRQDAMVAGNPMPPEFPDPTGPAPGAQMPAIDNGFPGLKHLDQTDLNQRVYPPDPDGDIGPNHYVQIVNSQLAIFDRDGNMLMAPLNNNLMWLGFAGGNCAVNNDGDPIVQYDQYADRWLITQFSVSGPGHYECVAVSTSPDPTGTYHRYAFEYQDFPDYPKLGVWPDAYYVTYNMFADGVAFAGVTTCALERAQMLAGRPARQQCVHEEQEFGLLPSDATGPTPPPAGSPNYLVGEHWDDNELLTMYKFSADWANPAASTWVGPIHLPVNAFTWACLTVNRGQCIPQPATDVNLESLGARMMYRLDYRNFGTHESLVVNHTVAMDANLGLTTQTGLAWYELRDLDQPVPTVYQEGTSADADGTTYRWMASMAMDKAGNMALGYSFGSATEFPSIGVVGRLAGDPLNQMTQAEAVIRAGSGSQTGVGARWGDYSSMQLDPLDDCTFWYTNEFLEITAPTAWSTWVANFSYPGCSGSAVAPQAPQSAVSAPGNRSAVVSWAPPADSGGMAVVGYQVTATPGTATCSTRVGVDPDPLACTLTDLANGTAFQVNITAYNAIGASSAAAVTVTPASVPAAPSAVSGTRGAGQVAVSWDAAADDGGSPVTHYTATALPGGATCTTPSGATLVPTSCTVTGLANGVPYTFTVAATNAFGTGGASAASAPVAPATVPDAPSAVVAAAGDRSASVAWVAPAFDGGSPVTGHTATASPGGASCTATTPQASCQLVGLANATSYTVSVVAANSVGSGAASAPSAPVTPAAPPVLAVAVPAMVGPAASLPVAIAGAGPGCRVDVALNGATVGGLADSLGAASFTITAPQPNASYPVTAMQSGPGCPGQQAGAAVVVSGVYITGSSKVSKGKSATYRGREFPAGKNVKWKLVRNGKTVASEKVKASKSGVSKAKFKFAKKGTYMLTATRGVRTASFEVRVR